jgi:hypothetical protein
MIKTKSGQIAIMLLLVLIILTTITTAVVAIAFSTSRDTTAYTLGEQALSVADSGAENAILNILRNSSYTGDTNLPVGDGTVSIVVTTNGTNKTVVSTGTVGTMVRKIELQLTLAGGKLTVVNRQEI